MSRGRKLNSNSLVSSGAFSSAPVSAMSGCVTVVNATRSPKFDFMNSASFDFSSSGEGKGGFCSMVWKRKSNTRARPVNGSGYFDGAFARKEHRRDSRRWHLGTVEKLAK